MLIFSCMSRKSFWGRDISKETEPFHSWRLLSASIHPGNFTGINGYDSTDSSCKRVDAALYEAKHTGKNKAVSL